MHALDRLITTEGSYEVRVGPSEMDKDAQSAVYKVVNVDYDVIEAETSCLPQALVTARSYNANVNEFFEEDVEGLRVPGDGPLN